MIADSLRTEIERFARDVERENALFVGAAKGRITPNVLARYLKNVEIMIGRTPYFMERARDRALETGRPALAEHFTDKWAEEAGHERWAAADLGRLRRRFGAAEPEAALEPALLGLCRLLDETIDRDPALYLAYILFAEYHTVLMGPRWIELLETRCGIPSSMLSVVGRHAELDKEHTAEGLEAIDALVTDPQMLEPMRETLRGSMQLFQRFCTEVVERGSETGAEAPCATPSPA